MVRAGVIDSRARRCATFPCAYWHTYWPVFDRWPRRVSRRLFRSNPQIRVGRLNGPKHDKPTGSAQLFLAPCIADSSWTSHRTIIPLDKMTRRTSMANGAREIANDAAPAGVADGTAPSDERSPLLQRSDAVGYSTGPDPEAVDGKLAEGRHFNLAGLTPNRFWVLVRRKQSARLELTSRCRPCGCARSWSLLTGLSVSRTWPNAGYVG